MSGRSWKSFFPRGEATATDVFDGMKESPTRTAVRTFLRILEEKSHIEHTKRGREFVYRPVHAWERTGKSAFGRVLKTFFGGSLEKSIASYLANPDTGVSPTELKRLSALINDAKRKDLAF